MTFTAGNLESLKSNPAWEHIVAVFVQELQKGEVTLSQEGEFHHGKGLGIRDTAKLLLQMTEKMEKMLEKK